MTPMVVLQKPGVDVDKVLDDVRREDSSRERRLENEFEADRVRLQRDARNRTAAEDREYKARLKEIERYEESLLQLRRKRRRQEDTEVNERQKAIKQVSAHPLLECTSMTFVI